MIRLKPAVSWRYRCLSRGISAMPLSIDIISDVVCPWCFIGKRRLEAALELYRERDPGAPAPQVAYHPFELNPDVPREGIARADYIAKKFGARGYSAHERLTHAGAQLGIPFAFDRIARQPNTLAAHALIEWARRRGVQPAVKEALMKAFFVDGLDLTDTTTLVRVATEAGLDRGEAAACIADEDLRRTVAEEEEKARAMGVQGVPFFIFNNKLAVEGAQPADVLLDAMLEAEKESAAA
jgi:predicted DsbA family dithiol-disulfide isomerase